MHRFISVLSVVCLSAFILSIAPIPAEAQEASPLRMYPDMTQPIPGKLNDTTETSIVIVNEGERSIRILGPWFSKRSESAFVIGSRMGDRMETGEINVFRILFIPVDTGSVFDTLFLVYNRGTEFDTLSIPVRGDVPGHGALSLHVSPKSFDDGPHLVGNDFEIMFLLENRSPDTMRIDSVQLLGEHSRSFTFTEKPKKLLAPSELGFTWVLASSETAGQRWCLLQINLEGGYMVNVFISITWLWDQPILDIRSNPMQVGTAMLSEECSRALTLYNIGTKILVLNDLRLSGPDSADFKISPTDSLKIYPDYHGDITVTFHPSTLGVKSAELHMRTNDPLRPDAVVAVQGSGIEYQKPDIAASSRQLHFIPAYIGFPKSATIVIYNRGNTILYINKIEHRKLIEPRNQQCEIVIQPSAGQPVMVGDSLALIVTCTPTRFGSARSTIVLHSNDPGTPEFLIDVQQSGIYPDPPSLKSEPVHLVFPSVPVSDSLDAILRILWSGGVLVWGQEINGPDAAHFRIIDSLRERTNQGYGEVRIRYYQQEAGSHIAFFQLHNSMDPGNPIFEVPLLGFDVGTSGSDVIPHREEISVSAWPNPFTAATTVMLSLPHPGAVQLELVDMSGRQVYTSSFQAFEPGTHLIPLDTRNFLPGMYLLRLAYDNTARIIPLVRLSR
ncbi:MAG: choice-of-anchor D domain-containing protein [Bacteroidota bacterium]